MKTPKEKAKELVEKYKLINYDTDDIESHKEGAFIAVDEILENVDYFFVELEKDGLPNKFTDEIKYWETVKLEIQKL